MSSTIIEGGGTVVDEATGEVIEGVVDMTGDEESRELAEYRPSIVMSPEQAKAQADAIREGVEAVLRDGVDYGLVPGAGPKPVLLKPGAEWLLKWFGFGSEIEEYRLERDEGGKPWGVTYRARVTKALNDGRLVTVSVCDGYAGYDENKFDNGRNYRAPWNTVIKMAQKRAIVGATLLATGTSGLFTQDIEDYSDPGQRPNISASSSADGGARFEGKPQVRNPNDPPTDKQKGFFHRLLDEHDIDDETYRAAMRQAYDVESVAELTKGQLSGLIDRLTSEDGRQKFRDLAAQEAAEQVGGVLDGMDGVEF